ncbi:hypothetical protein BU24DRAFT_425209 [Aaosphaeria arxii CBS 175.79]|uniref:Uncharacterized protein n=1 Tax=Aaosphaeria arxii CBS 175.79 TaxID=1450172 RepID=A0A6A5XIC1_9PLEO|nr:uncharacterized protein BU24DRAFT_425209 [Aaosphaeria arxii CBS 175.79]KAF2012571.1 hypothetical protein BU24DRAFT_425209 [Aaosphaeria arxii CBS 175.79]
MLLLRTSGHFNDLSISTTIASGRFRASLSEVKIAGGDSLPGFWAGSEGAGQPTKLRMSQRVCLNRLPNSKRFPKSFSLTPTRPSS